MIAGRSMTGTKHWQATPETRHPNWPGLRNTTIPHMEAYRQVRMCSSKAHVTCFRTTGGEQIIRERTNV